MHLSLPQPLCMQVYCRSWPLVTKLSAIGMYSEIRPVPERSVPVYQKHERDEAKFRGDSLFIPTQLPQPPKMCLRATASRSRATMLPTLGRSLCEHSSLTSSDPCLLSSCRRHIDTRIKAVFQEELVFVVRPRDGSAQGYPS